MSWRQYCCKAAERASAVVCADGIDIAGNRMQNRKAKGVRVIFLGREDNQRIELRICYQWT